MGFIKSSYHTVFAYRLDVLIGLFNNLVLFTIQYYLWKAVFAASGGIFLGIEESNYILYLGFGLLLSQLTGNSIDRRIALGVRTGNIVFDLLRPFRFEYQMYSHACGEQVARSFGIIPIAIVLLFILDFNSISFDRIVFFLPSAFFAIVLSFQINLLYGMLAFKATNTWGLHLLKVNLFPLLSGQIVAFSVLEALSTGAQLEPTASFISILAGVIYWLSYVLPFQAIFFTPSGILSGLIPTEIWLFHLLLQIFWVTVLFGTTRFTIKKFMTSYEVQGG